MRFDRRSARHVCKLPDALTAEVAKSIAPVPVNCRLKDVPLRMLKEYHASCLVEAAERQGRPLDDKGHPITAPNGENGERIDPKWPFNNDDASHVAGGEDCDGAVNTKDRRVGRDGLDAEGEGRSEEVVVVGHVRDWQVDRQVNRTSSASLGTSMHDSTAHATTRWQQ
eukprot:1593802-Pleurochrysis_carterae.AAC.1